MECPVVNDAVSSHKEFASHYINAELSVWYYYLVTAIEEVALIKLMDDTTELLGDSLTSAQVAVGVKEGVSKILFTVHTRMELNPDQVFFKFEFGFSNTFNDTRRQKMLQEI